MVTVVNKQKKVGISTQQTAFTIVELLIVIVVIGILAAIILIAFNGVQQKARVAATQSALEQASKKLAIYQVTNSGYPTQLSDAGVTDSSGTSYQYSVNNNANPATYCVTATTGTTSYYINNTDHTSPTSGGCPGDGVGGIAAITNLAIDPEATGGTSHEWQPRYSTNQSWITGASDGPTSQLNTYERQTIKTTVTASGRGVDHHGNIDTTTNTDTTWPVAQGTTYSISDYVRSSESNSLTQILCRTHDSTGTWLDSTGYGQVVNYTAGQWVRISLVFTAGANGYMTCSSRFGAAITWTVGDTMDATGLMVTKGSSLYNFADGSSPNWKWNGTLNAASSTGPPLS